MAARGPLVLSKGELRDIEEAARVAAKAVEHMRARVDYATWACGHRRTTACNANRCTTRLDLIQCESA